MAGAAGPEGVKRERGADLADELGSDQVQPLQIRALPDWNVGADPTYLPFGYPLYYDTTLNTTGVSSGSYTLVMRVRNPLENVSEASVRDNIESWQPFLPAKKFRFANAEQGADGWLRPGQRQRQLLPRLPHRHTHQYASRTHGHGHPHANPAAGQQHADTHSHTHAPRRRRRVRPALPPTRLNRPATHWPAARWWPLRQLLGRAEGRLCRQRRHVAVQQRERRARRLAMRSRSPT